MFLRHSLFGLFLPWLFRAAVRRKSSLKKPGRPLQQKRQKKVSASEKIDLRILYAGLPNTERAKDFVDFLTKHFKEVETTDYNTFKGDKTAGFDVTIIDYNGQDTRAPLPSISREYSRATITVGSPGADLCSRLSLKTGYL